MADCSSMMSATQEACQDELQMADAMCSGTIGFSGSAAASNEASDGLPGRQLQEGDWQEIVYKVSIHSVQQLQSTSLYSVSSSTDRWLNQKVRVCS